MIGFAGMLLPHAESNAQITMLQDYKNFHSPAIGTYQGINFREAGFSGMYPIANTNGKEFWICSDRGVNIDGKDANPSGCHPTYDKIYSFPNYAPKIHRIRVNGDSVEILQTITMKRPDGSDATGIINPTGFGSTAEEIPSTDTVQDCSRFSIKTVAKDVWGIDAEGLVVDGDGNFWVCEEGGPTVWKMSPTGVVLQRYSPYATMSGATSIDVPIDTVFKYRKNNRGFEGIAITPNGKIYAIIQSPILYPDESTGEDTRVHRILEIDPATSTTRMFAYLNDGVIGSGSDRIRLKDWKMGDMAAINDSTFLVIQAAARGSSNIKKIYKININGATNVTSGLYGGLTLEGLADSAGLAAHGITPVKKTLFMDLLAHGWDPALDKAEGLAIINDSTIAVSNDNDYGQYSPDEDGLAVATTNLSHVVTYRLSGSNKLENYEAHATDLSLGVTGPSTSRTPYLVPTVPGAWFTSILTSEDVVGGYKMCGTPDGLGTFDNGDGTFTVVMNHEFSSSAGINRAHGENGSFVSKWIINKSDYSVVSGEDLIQTVKLWNPVTSSYISYSSSFPSTSTAFNRFCSADLPEISAFYNSTTGKGTMERIFMNGEEAGSGGRGFGHIVTGADAGTTYELPYLGKFSWENSIACPTESDTTMVIGTDDATPGQIYVYLGNKRNVGNDIEKAGLTGGKLFGIAVSGMTVETNSSLPTPGTPFSLAEIGHVQNMSGSAINSASNIAGVTNFLRPEDGAWDPSNPNDFYFVTTNSFSSPSRLWKVHFTNPSSPSLGGTVEAVLDGTEGQRMLDNITIDHYGHILMVEDVGGNDHIGKIWQYTITTDDLKQVGAHDTARFLPGAPEYLTRDEEASGILDAELILGPGMFLIDDQPHYNISGEVVQGGQFLVFFNPDSYNSAPEIDITGSSVSIADGDMTPSTTDNTDFGNAYVSTAISKTFVIENNGEGILTVSSMNLAGAHAGDYTFVSPPTLPLTIAGHATQSITISFSPSANGSRTAMLNIGNSDINERMYHFALKGNGIDSPEIHVQGNYANILDGDMTPGTGNHTEFGEVNTGSIQIRTFMVHNIGLGNLKVTAINFTGADSADFTLNTSLPLPITIAAGDSTAIAVKFSPSDIGDRNAIVHFMNTDANESDYDFAIHGKGMGMPEINIQGNGIDIADGDVTPGTSNNTDFGDVHVGSEPVKTFLIQNTGAGTLTVSSISFSGTNASEFTLYGAPGFPITIPESGSQSFDVRFAPVGTGSRTATLTIANSDDNESVYDFALKGTGIASLGIASKEVSSSIRLFPNPTGSDATLSLNLVNDANLKIDVVDMQGRVATEGISRKCLAGENNIAIKTSDLSNGIYFVKVSDEISTTNIKMVIIH